jgi:hypothetical protein
MRIMLAIPLLLLGACQVSKDDANNAVSVTYNEDVAANAAADVSNTAENIAAGIGNEVKDAGNKIENTDLSVNFNRDVKTENKTK